MANTSKQKTSTKRKTSVKKISQKNSSRIAKKSTKPSNSKKVSLPELFLIIIIITAIIAVGLSLFLRAFFNEKVVLERTLRNISTEYYEQYLYGNLVKDNSSEEVLEEFAELGTQNVRLRQLLYYENGKNTDKISIFDNADCDKNATSVKYYPYAPYGRKDYRAEYTWSCRITPDMVE